MIGGSLICGICKFFASVCGIGFLPTWNRHWAAVAGAFLGFIVCYFTVGVQGDLAASNFGAVGAVLLVTVLYVFLIALITTPVFSAVDQQPIENMVIDVLLCQILLMALCIPANIALSEGMNRFLEYVCREFFVCPLIVLKSAKVLVQIGLPFGIFRGFDIWEAWPSALLVMRYPKSATARALATFVNLTYALLLMYFVAFVFCGLSVTNTIIYMQYIFAILFEHALALLIFVLQPFAEGGFVYVWLADMGALGWLDVSEQ